MSVAVREQTEVNIGENRYLITALGASAGFETLRVLAKLEESGEVLPEPNFIKKVITSCVTVNNLALTSDKYEVLFSGRKLTEAVELFQNIVAFNFGSNDPNGQSATLEE